MTNIITPDFGDKKESDKDNFVSNEDMVKGNIDKELENLQEQTSKEKNVIFKCEACGYEVTEKMYNEGAKILSLNIQFPVLICTNCRTLQLLKDVHDKLLEEAKSKIIKI